MKKCILLLPLLLTASDFPGTGAWKGIWELSNPAYAYAQSRSGTVGVGVYDDSTGTLYTFNGTVKFRCASIIKVGIMAAVLNRAAQENRWLTSWEQDQLAPMIEWSDNAAATNLWNYIGPENVVANLQSIGMSNTGFEADVPTSWWGYVDTCAKDMTTLLARLYYHQIATAALCDYGLGLMTQIASSQSWGVKGGLPPGTWVAFKNGWYPEDAVWRVHSVGVVKTGAGKSYVCCVLTRYDVGLGMQYGIDTCEQVSSKVYAAIAGEPSTSAAAVRVTASLLNVRSGPGTGYSIVGTIPQGQYYVRIAQQNGWSQVYYAGNTGWCYSGYLVVVGGVSAIKCAISALNVRTGPGTGYAIVGQIHQGEMYFWTQYEGLNGWYKFYWKGGSYYCSGGYVTKVPLP